MNTENLKNIIKNHYHREYTDKVGKTLPRAYEKTLKKKADFLEDLPGKATLFMIPMAFGGIALGTVVASVAPVLAPVFAALYVSSWIGAVGALAIGSFGSDPAQAKYDKEKSKNDDIAEQKVLHQLEQDIDNGSLFTRYKKEYISVAVKSCEENIENLTSNFNDNIKSAKENLDQLVNVKKISVTEFKKQVAAR